MPELKLYSGGDDLVKTTLHGMEQNAFVVTEDRMNNFNSYSLDFQIYLTLFSIFLGSAISNTSDMKKNIFIVSASITAFLFIFLIWSGIKFKKIRNSLFVKTDKFLTSDGIEIISALYGSNDKFVDVKEKISSLIKNNKLDLKVSNDIDGDPVPGVQKELKIKYKIKGQSFERVVKEGLQLLLP